MSLFNLTQTSLYYKVFVLIAFVEKNSMATFFLLLQPLKSTIPVEANKRQQIVIGDLSNKTSRRSFEIWHTSVAREIFVHVQGYAYVQKRPNRAPISQMCLNLKYYTNRKWRTRQGCVCSIPHTESLCNRWKIYWLRHLKNNLANHCWALS